jgi:hypothetical protein
MDPEHFVHHVADARQANLIHRLQSDPPTPPKTDASVHHTASVKLAWLFVLLVAGVVLIAIAVQTSTP